MEKIRLAKAVATIAHHGQVDKSGKPYILHPKTVAESVSRDSDKVVAWLHDVVEDSSTTVEQIRRCFGRKTAKAVDAITQRDDESREEYICRVKKNSIARRVKIADLAHNSDLSRIEESRSLNEHDYARALRYIAEMVYLASR